MSNVVPFGGRSTETPAGPEEERVWVCQCGCSTFELVDPGYLQCALCKTHASPDGGWHATGEVPAFTNTWVGDAPVKTITGNNSTDFAKRLIVQRSMEDDAVAVIVVREGGMIHAWSNVETDAQTEWVHRRMDDAKGLVRKA